MQAYFKLQVPPTSFFVNSLNKWFPNCIRLIVIVNLEYDIKRRVEIHKLELDFDSHVI